jgi:hypothetical protein
VLLHEHFRFYKHEIYIIAVLTSLGTHTELVQFEAFTAVTMRNVVFWEVALCRSCVNRRFGGTYRLYLQGRKIRERETSLSRWLQAEPPVGNNQLPAVELHHRPHPTPLSSLLISHVAYSLSPCSYIAG